MYYCLFLYAEELVKIILNCKREHVLNPEYSLNKNNTIAVECDYILQIILNSHPKFKQDPHRSA